MSDLTMMDEDEEEGTSRNKILLRKWWVDNRERISEFYRLYFHTYLVTFLIALNMWLGYSSLMIYFSQWKHTPGGVEGFLSLFTDTPPVSLSFFMNLFFIPLDHNPIVWFLIVLNLPVITWLYSTNSQPIMKGYKTLLTWKSKRGRVAALLLSAIPFITHYCSLFAWYVDHYLFDFFASVSSDKEFLSIKSMASFGYILMCVPVFISLQGIYLVVKQFHMNEDLRKMFVKWEFSLLASQSFSLRNNKCDVIVGWEKKTNKPIILHEVNRYLHELIVGATGTGKTSTAIIMRIVQDLIRIARGKKLGICVLEPKGDLVQDVLMICEKLGIPKSKIKVVDPTKLHQSIKFNPFVGPLEAAAETFRGVLDALAGDQDDFFKGQQSETASAYTMLGKIRYNNLFNITHMQKMYTDPRYLANLTEEVRTYVDRNKENPNISKEDQAILDRYDRIVSYFEDEVLEYKTYKDKEHNILPVTYQDGHKYAGRQVVENKKDKFVAGAKKYINDICMNSMLSQLMVANDGEDVLDLDEFLREGGVLLVNTALGELEELSLSFGQFFIRQFQSSVFRRPLEVNGYKRIPIFLSIDEFALYINEAFSRLLTLGRSFKVGTLIAIQSLGQLQTVVQGYDRVILSNASNKTVFGRGEIEDNKLFSEQFGEEYQVEESMNESMTPASMPNQSWGFRLNTARTLEARYTPTDIMEQDFKHFIVQMVEEDGSLRVPIEAYGKFINETKFLKKFFKIGETELLTKEHQVLNTGAYKKLLSSLFPVSDSKGDPIKDNKANSDHELVKASEEQTSIDEPGKAPKPVQQQVSQDIPVDQEIKNQNKILLDDNGETRVVAQKIDAEDDTIGNGPSQAPEFHFDPNTSVPSETASREIDQLFRDISADPNEQPEPEDEDVNNSWNIQDFSEGSFFPGGIEDLMMGGGDGYPETPVSEVLMMDVTDSPTALQTTGMVNDVLKKSEVKTADSSEDKKSAVQTKIANGRVSATSRTIEDDV